MNLSCLLCYQASPAPVCHWCEDDIFFFDERLHGSNLLHYAPVAGHVKHSHYDALSVLGLHAWPMSSLVHQLKFTHSLTAGKVLSHWFVHKKRQCTLTVPHLLLPVPISAWRLATRHYNQAAVLSHQLSYTFGIPIDHQWARRQGLSVQHHLSRVARAENASRVFHLSASCIDHSIKALGHKKNGRGLTVAIVDDVLTTGVTVNTLSKQLKMRYPKITVQVWAAAFTPPPKSSLFQYA